MISITWIITTLAVLICLAGIIATIVIRVDNIPKWKTVGKILIWVIGLLIFRIIFWGMVKYHDEIKPQKTAAQAAKAASVVQLKEEWVFSQINSNGEKATFEVEITKRETGLLYALIQENKNGKKLNVAGIRLNEIGCDLFGTWANYLVDDYGKMTLYKIDNNTWSGQYDLKDKTFRLCTLKRK